MKIRLDFRWSGFFPRPSFTLGVGVSMGKEIYWEETGRRMAGAVFMVGLLLFHIRVIIGKELPE